jgi:hypothetical protein
MIDFIIGLIYILVGFGLLFICFKFIFKNSTTMEDAKTNPITIKSDGWAYIRFWGNWYKFETLGSYILLLILFPLGFHLIASGVERMAGF